MRQQQFIRFVQEICYLLKLSQPCSKTALNYFLTFKQYQGHSYDKQILMATSIYLSVKIFQQQARIRDILNMIYVITSLYRLSAQKKQHQKQNAKIEQKDQQKNQKQQQKDQQEEQQQFISLKNLKNQKHIHQMIQPQYSLSDYNQYKGKIIQAQQLLLRILGFDFKQAQQNKIQLKRLLIMIHHLRCPATLAKTIMKIYSDIHYIDIKYWSEGLVYFGYLSTKIYTEKFKNTQKRSLLSSKQLKQVQNLEQFYNRVKYNDLAQIFCIELRQLQKYSQKLIMFYESITTQNQYKTQNINKMKSQIQVQKQKQNNNSSQKIQIKNNHIIISEQNDSLILN